MNYINVLTFSLILLCFTIGIANASCYSKAEAEAEQGIRIHSELMVISLNCQHMSQQGGRNLPKDLYARYRKFTKDHSSLLANYEERLINFYQKQGHPNPELDLHDLRTMIANNVSLGAAQMRPDIFCKNYARRLVQVSNIDTRLLQKWAATLYKNHPVSQPLCKG